MGDKIKFIPVYGKKASIDEQVKKPGHIYFSTDSGEIFLDKSEDERIRIGGTSSGASLFYSSQGGENDPINPDEESSTETTTYYLLDAEAVDVGEGKIKEDDLIIGADGAFYRVFQIREDGQYLCTRMAISGGGGGSDQPSLKRRFKINLEKLNPSTLINGQKTYVYFTVESAIDQNDTILDEEFVVYLTLSEKVSGTSNSYINYYTGQLDVNNEERSFFDITEFLRENATTKITLYAVGIENGTSK